jgi:hypothetical protein
MEISEGIWTNKNRKNNMVKRNSEAQNVFGSFVFETRIFVFAMAKSLLQSTQIGPTRIYIVNDSSSSRRWHRQVRVRQNKSRK